MKTILEKNQLWIIKITPNFKNGISGGSKSPNYIHSTIKSFIWLQRMKANVRIHQIFSGQIHSRVYLSM